MVVVLMFFCFEDMLLHKITVIYIKWCLCHYHLRCLHDFHVWLMCNGMT